MQHSLKCSVHHLCGGCTYQHLEADNYQALKTDYFKKVFNAASEVYQEPIFIPAQTRRRTTISFYHDGEQYVWGYKQAKSHKIISAHDCIVVTPEILEAMNALGRWIPKIIKPNIQIKAHITQIDNGLDISIRGIKLPNAKKSNPLIQELSEALPSMIRLSVDHEMVFQLERPYIQIEDHKIETPAEVFLQPSKQGQDILIDLVTKNIGKTSKKTKIIDLFSGLGTFTLPLSNFGTVTAYDNAGNAIDTLKETVENYGLGHKITVKKRDLFRDPISFLELKDFDIAIIDPPRAGALAQITQIVKSKIKRIIYVFCNAETANRDIKLLENSGYQLQSLRAVDQFIYSDHIEGVAILTK